MKFQIIVSETISGKEISKQIMSTHEVLEMFYESIPAEIFQAEPGKEVVFYYKMTEVTAKKLK